jgi:hypothetical protein
MAREMAIALIGQVQVVMIGLVMIAPVTQRAA